MRDEDMTIGQRLAKRRDEVGLTQEQLATAVGFKSGQSVSNIENGSQRLTIDKVEDTCIAIRCSITWLLTGVPSPDEVNDANATGGSGWRLPSVPHIAFESVLAMPASRVAEELVPVRFHTGPKSFAMDVFDNANEDEFKRGHKLVIDPDRAPIPGDMVLVALGKPERVFFGMFVEQAPDDAPPGSVAINFIKSKVWKPRHFIEGKTGRFLGVMTEHARSRR